MRQLKLITSKEGSHLNRKLFPIAKGLIRQLEINSLNSDTATMRDIPVYGEAAEMAEIPVGGLRPFGTVNSPVSARGLRFRVRYGWMPG